LSSFFAYLAKSGLCLALGYGVYWLVLKKETYFALNRAYLLGTAALALVLPLFRIPSPFLTTVATSAAPAAVPALPSLAAQTPAAFDPWRAILLIYLAGAGFLASRFALRLARLVRAVLKRGGERRDGFRVVVCDHPGGPFSFFNVIFLDRSQGLARDWRRILAHEMAHVRQIHTADIIISECLAILQWFNPFVWPYRDSLRETHEYLADRAAIAQGGSLAGYQLLILEQSVGGKLLGLASSFRTSQVKRRLQMLTRKKSKGWTRVKPLLILPLGALLLLAFAEAKVVVQPGPEAVLPQTQPASNPPAQKEMSEEETLKILQEKFAKLQQMKQENKAKMAEIEAALQNATDGNKSKLLEKLKAAQVTSLELNCKDLTLQMKKLELSLNKETDPVKQEKLKQIGSELKSKYEACAQKLAELKPADEETKKK